MATTEISTWLDQLIKNIPLLVVSVVFMGLLLVIAYKIISTQSKMTENYLKQSKERQAEEKENRECFRKDVRCQLDKTLSFYQDVNASLPMIKSFIEKYPKFESIVGILNQTNHPYFGFVEVIMSRIKYSFITIFKNGSKEEDAMKVINKNYEHVLRTITEDQDLINKRYHVTFADFLKEECTFLVKDLLKEEDHSIKIRMIEMFFTNMNNSFYFFRIHLNDDLLKKSPEEVKEELINYFGDLADYHIKNECDVPKEKETIFGF